MSPLDEIAGLEGGVGDYARAQIASPPEALEQPQDTAKREIRQQAQASAQVARDSAESARVGRMRAADFASRSVPTFRDELGAVQPVRDSSGAALTKLDRRNSIAWDSLGQPQKISYDETGAPALADPYQNAPVTTDKSGNQYKVTPGLPWQWTGTDEAAAAKAQRDERDKAVNAAAAALGGKLSLDHHAAVTADTDLKTAQKQFGSLATKRGLTPDSPAGSALNDALLSGDPNAAHAALDSHFASLEDAPEAQFTTHFWSSDLSPQSQQYLSDLQKDRSDAHRQVDTILTSQARSQGARAREAATRQAAEQARAEQVDSRLAALDQGDQIADNNSQQGELDSVQSHKLDPAGSIPAPVIPSTVPGALPAATETAPGEPATSPTPEAAPFAPDEAPFRQDQNGVTFDPKRLTAGLTAARDAGVIDADTVANLLPKAKAAEEAYAAQEKLLANDTIASKIKALGVGATKGGAFLATAPIGAGVGGEIGAFGGPGTAAVGAALGGLLTGSLGAFGAGKIIKKLGEYSDTIKGFQDAAEAHPYYDAAGNLVAFGAGIPKVASKAIGEGIGALAGEGANAGKTAAQVAGEAQAAAKAASAAGIPNVVTPAGAKLADVLNPANLARAAAKGYESGGGGVASTISNLTEEAQRRALAGASPAEVAKIVGMRLGGNAVGMALIDTVIKEGSKALGISDQGQTLGGAAQAALLGTFFAGHGLEFPNTSPGEMASIISRARARMDAGVSLADGLQPHQMPAGIDMAGAQELARPLTSREMILFGQFNDQVKSLISQGKIAAPQTVEDKLALAKGATGKEILQSGQRIGGGVEVIPPTASPETGPSGTQDSGPSSPPRLPADSQPETPGAPTPATPSAPAPQETPGTSGVAAPSRQPQSTIPSSSVLARPTKPAGQGKKDEDQKEKIADEQALLDVAKREGNTMAAAIHAANIKKLSAESSQAGPPAGTAEPSVVPAEAKAEELMTPEEFDAMKAETDRRFTEEAKEQAIKEGRDPNKVTSVRQSERGAMSRALSNGMPVNADLFDRYNANSERKLTLPDGYVREGDHYVKKEQVALDSTEATTKESAVPAPEIPASKSTVAPPQSEGSTEDAPVIPSASVPSSEPTPSRQSATRTTAKSQPESPSPSQPAPESSKETPPAPRAGEATSSPESAPEIPATQRRITGPALIHDGKIVAQGTIGQKHADLIREAAQRGEDVTDAERGFVDDQGSPLTRAEAEPIARASGQIKEGTKIGASGLQSEHLTEFKSPDTKARDRDTGAKHDAEFEGNKLGDALGLANNLAADVAEGKRSETEARQMARMANVEPLFNQMLANRRAEPASPPAGKDFAAKKITPKVEAIPNEQTPKENPSPSASPAIPGSESVPESQQGDAGLDEQQRLETDPDARHSLTHVSEPLRKWKRGPLKAEYAMLQTDLKEVGKGMAGPTGIGALVQGNEIFVHFDPHELADSMDIVRRNWLKRGKTVAEANKATLAWLRALSWEELIHIRQQIFERGGPLFDKNYGAIWRLLDQSLRDAFAKLRNTKGSDQTNAAELERMVIQYRETGTVTEALTGNPEQYAAFIKLKHLIDSPMVKDMEDNIDRVMTLAAEIRPGAEIEAPDAEAPAKAEQPETARGPPEKQSPPPGQVTKPTEAERSTSKESSSSPAPKKATPEPKGKKLRGDKPEDYRGEHGAPDKESGAPLHALNTNGIYPDDIYTHAQRYYGTGDDAMDAQAFSIIQSMRGKSNAKLPIYRAVPRFLKDAGFNRGDWVTTVKKYAVDHGKSALNGDYRILTKMVAARDIFTNGDSALEWGYDPQPVDMERRKTVLAERLQSNIRRIEAGEKIAGINKYPDDRYFGRDGEWLRENKPAKLSGDKPLTGERAVVPPSTKVAKFGNANISEQGPIFLQGDKPLTAHHGTPHKVDKFTISKIGSGEGNQSYGWGLYFAENPEVAGSYQDSLARGFKPSEEYRYKGKSGEFWYDHFVKRKDYDKAAVWEKVMLHMSKRETLAQLEEYPQASKDYAMSLPGELFAPAGGATYTVEINATPDEIIDWDKPISEQNPKVREAMESVLTKEYPAYMKALKAHESAEPSQKIKTIRDNGFTVFDIGTAGMAVEKLGWAMSSPKKASMAFMKAGIAGVRYLDQGSRESKHGTFNYVIFDDSKIRITHENGEPVKLADAMEGAQVSGDKPVRAEQTAEYAKLAKRQDALHGVLENLSPEQRAKHETPTGPVTGQRDLVRAYSELVDKSGFPAVPIADLMESVGFTGQEAMKRAKGILMSLHKNGKATFGKGDWSLSSDREKAWSVVTKGEQNTLVELRTEGLKGDKPQSSVTPEQDKAYMEAVEKGDTKEAQRMVDEAAKAAGYPVKAFHNTHSAGIKEFQPFARDVLNGEKTSAEVKVILERWRKSVKNGEKLGYMNFRAGTFFTPSETDYKGYGPNRYAVYLRAENPVTIEPGKVTSIKTPGISPDSLFIKNGDELKEIAIFDPSQIKSSDPITKDDKGRAIPLSERFNPQSNSILYGDKPESAPFYSQLTRTIETLPQATLTVGQAKAAISKGAKPDEIKTSGILDDPLSPLAGKSDTDKVTRYELSDYALERQTQVQDVTLGGGKLDPERESIFRTAIQEGIDGWDEDSLDEDEYPGHAKAARDAKELGVDALAALDSGDFKKASELVKDASSLEQEFGDDPAWKGARKIADNIPKDDGTHFSGYQLPGADEGSYREMFVTWPTDQKLTVDLWHKNLKNWWNSTHSGEEEFGRLSLARQDVAVIRYENETGNANPSRESKNWRDGHSQYSDIANPVVRIRRNLRTDADGKKTYFIEEIQGPGKSEQEKMPEAVRKRIYQVGMKRAIRDAVDSGADRIAWTPGGIQADRYSLEKQVIAIDWDPIVGTTRQHVRVNTQGGIISMETEGGKVVAAKNPAAQQLGLVGKPLEEVVGKEVAKKIEGEYKGHLEGEGLKIGGEGLKRLYDSTLPRIVEDLGKKFGVKVSPMQMKVGEEGSYGGDTSLPLFEQKLQEIRSAWDGPNRTAAGWQAWNVTLDRQAKDVLAAMKGGATYGEAMHDHGSEGLAEHFGGEYAVNDKSGDVHSFEIPKQWKESAPSFALYGDKPKLAERIQALSDASGWTSVVDDIQKVLAPDERLTKAERDKLVETGDFNSIGDARKTGNLLRGITAEMDRRKKQWEKALLDGRDMVDKLTPALKEELMMRMDEGTPLKPGPIADAVNKLADLDTKKVQGMKDWLDAHGMEHWQNFENFQKYMVPHYFTDQAQAGKLMETMLRDKKFQGGTGFLKHREGFTIREIIDYAKSQGIELKPKHDNVFDAVMDRWTQQERYMGAHDMIDRMEAHRTGHWEPVDYRPTVDERMVNNLIGNRTVEIDNGDGTTSRQRQNFFANEPSAQVVNNYLSRGLRANHKWVENYFTAANVLNSAQLGLSFFHGGFVTMEGMVSSFALGLQKVLSGDASGLKDIMTSPISTWQDWKLGGKIRDEILNPGSYGAQHAAVVNAMVSAGFRDGMDSFYRDNHTSKLLTAFREGRYLPALLRAPWALIETLAKPLMEHYVPRLKAAAIYKLAQMHLKNSPNMSAEQLHDVLSKDVESGNNRFGQMTYDNLHLHKVVKDLLMGMTRSLGWNWGTFSELGGGIGDWLKYARDAARATGDRMHGAKEGAREFPKVSNKQAYTLALPLLVGLMGATLSAMFGKRPKELKDYYFIQTGETDDRGNPVRVVLPSYMKDVFHAAHDPVSTVTNKLHPLLSTLGAMLQNKDFYGTEIRHSGDPVMKQILQELGYVGKQFVPFTGRNAAKYAGAPPIVQAGGFLGLTQAPARMGKSAAQNLADEISSASRPTKTRTTAEAEKAQTRAQIIGLMRQGKGQAELAAAQRTGILSPSDLPYIERTARMTPLQASVSHLSVADAERVIEKATPEERRQLEPILTAKRANAGKKNTPITRDFGSPKVTPALAGKSAWATL